MAVEELSLAIRVKDLSLDEHGRVTITDPQVARLVEAAAAREQDVEVATDPTTNNCHGGNCAAGCGVKK